MIYLACPYSDPDPALMEARFHYATKVAGHLMLQGHVVFSPITHSHIVAKDWQMPTSWEFWAKQDLHIIDRCDAVYVLQIPGWHRSIGVNAELDHAIEMLKLIVYLDPQTLPAPLNTEFPIPSAEPPNE